MSLQTILYVFRFLKHFVQYDLIFQYSPFMIYFLIKSLPVQDKGTVGWLERYLQQLTDTTVICVSHDTPFVENICTDVIHYESRAAWGPHRKLVHYTGKMSAFVEKQPAAKHYFELAKTDLTFKFPEPGRLEGIKTSTQKFLEMENVNYRYPGAAVDTLNNVNLKMSLSSRVAILGANGAGTCDNSWVINICGLNRHDVSNMTLH